MRRTESFGLRLSHRDRKWTKLQCVDTGKVVVRLEVLEVFAFTSKGKRIVIVVQFMAGEKREGLDFLGGRTGEENSNGGDIWFNQKGGDTVMTLIVQANDWLDGECRNMAWEGRRTLFIRRKWLSIQRYQEFSAKYKSMALSLVDWDRDGQGRDGEAVIEMS